MSLWCTLQKSTVIVKEKTVKNDLKKVSLLVLAAFVFLSGCNRTGVADAKNTQRESTKAPIKFAKQGKYTFDTIYADGRKTGVRNLNYYNGLIDNQKQNKSEKVKILYVMTEWNEYEAVVASPQSAFIQLPSNSMVGGDEETNRRVKEYAIRYFSIATKMFEKEARNLKMINDITDRSTDYVTFDFITNKGLYTIQEKKVALENNRSIWSELFDASKQLNSDVLTTQMTNKWKG
jgi:hypothetical protein